MTLPSALRHIANIGARGQRRRRLGGLFWLLIALASSAWFLVHDVPLLWYLALVVPFTLAAIGELQARQKT